MPAAPARHPAPARKSPNLLHPWARETRRERRVGYRLAAGLTPAQAARAERLPEAEVASLLADPAFAALVAECRALEARPEAEARASLASLARFLLTEAIVEGDLRAAMFVLRQEERGRCPARVLVDGVLASRRRAAAAPPPPALAATEPAPPPSSPPRASRDPVDRSLERIAAHFRDALVGEQFVVHRATAEPAPPPGSFQAIALPVSADVEAPTATGTPARVTTPDDTALRPRAGGAASPEAPEPAPPGRRRHRRERRRSAAPARSRRPSVVPDQPPPTRGPTPRARSP